VLANEIDHVPGDFRQGLFLDSKRQLAGPAGKEA
jgi:hypothetical protein